MAVFPSAGPQRSATFATLSCSLLLTLPARLHGKGIVRLSAGHLIEQTFPPNARILVDEDGTCARARMYEWHMYRETAKGILEKDMFQLQSVRDTNWREQLNWWYGLLTDEMSRPPKVIDCPIGRIFFSVLAFAVDFPGDHQFTLEELLVGPWRTNYTVMMFVLSGWPIFSLLSQMTRAYSNAAIGHPSTTWCPYQRLMEVIGGKAWAVQKFLRLTRARLRSPDSRDGLAHKSAQLAITVAELEGYDQDHSPPDFLLPKKVRMAISALPSFAEIAGALVARNSTLSALLGVVQSWFIMQSGCLDGTRLISARPKGGFAQPFRLCVRRKMEGLDAAATLFGEWETCSRLRQWHRDFVGPLPLESQRGPEETPCVIVDVGPHIGLCSLAFAAQGCRVVAIDILAQHAQMIFDSAQLNNIPNHRLTVVNAAVSDIDGGWVSVNGPGDGLPAQNTNIGDVVVGDGKEQHGGVVPRQTVDALLRRVGIKLSAVTMLKVDAEGHDLQVLRGAMETLTTPRQHRRSFLCDEIRCNEEFETGEEAMLSPKKLHTGLRGRLAIEPPVVVFECVLKEGGLQIVDLLQDLGMNTTRKNQALNYAMRLHAQ